jgi:hypothetical protein
MFENLRAINENAVTDMRGLIDPSNLKQFNLYEGGYGLLVVTAIPKFLQELATSDNDAPNANGRTYSQLYGPLIRTFVNVLEQEFRGLDGIENITSENGDFTNGISTISMINKVVEQSGSSQFTMRYTEKAGAVLSRVNELYLRGIKDTRTGYKTYHGLIADGSIPLKDVGYQSECFSFMYIITDNTGYRVERAFFIVGAQSTNADLNTLFNIEKGTYDFKELSIEFNGFPITGAEIDKKAQAYLDAMTGRVYDATSDSLTNDSLTGTPSDNFIYNSTDYSGYTALKNNGDISATVIGSVTESTSLLPKTDTKTK